MQATADAPVAGASGSLMTIPIAKIRENPVALRSVNRQSEAYVGLVDSIRQRGVLNPILVREIRDPETGDTLYGLIDGLHRFSGAQDAGLSEIPAQVRAMEDAAVLEAQIISNVHRIETQPVQYSKQLMRILAQNPTLTVSELATKLAKSPSWLGERLGLVKLPDQVGALVDEGKINLSNAYALAKLAAIAPDEVGNFIDRAMTQTPQEFVPTATSRIKELRDLKRQGRDATPAKFEAHPVLRKLSELKDEMTAPAVGPVLVQELGVRDPKAAFQLGVKWALQMDPATVKLREQKEADRVRALEEERSRKKAEREAEKQKKAAEEAAKIVYPK